VATVVVDLGNLRYAPDGNTFSLVVSTVWALLRALGFLGLMRAVRYGQVAARPLGLILATTTVFAVGRLVQPRRGDLLPPWPVVGGFLVLTALCAVVVWQLYRAPTIAAHLTRQWSRRHIPAWVLTARIATLSYGALILVPCLVAAGTLWHEPRIPVEYAVPVVIAWFVFGLGLGLLIPFLAIFMLFGRRSARVLLAGLSVLVMVVQPALCLLLLGPDGMIRNGAPLIIAAGLGLYALWRSRPGRGAADNGSADNGAAAGSTGSG
jgi:hypothetical protein